MGTDIHGVFQRFDEKAKGWLDVPTEYEFNRHYQLFAVLADVRNGYGFAGVTTGEPVKPISEPRDLPEGFAIDDNYYHPIDDVSLLPRWRREYAEKFGEALEEPIWMGDHSFSWLTGDEMLAWYKGAPKVIHTGVLTREAYTAWDKTGTPSGSFGGVTGRAVVLVNDNEVEKEATPNWNYIRVEWEANLHEELAYFFDEVARLASEHGKIRFVFGFDS